MLASVVAAPSAASAQTQVQAVTLPIVVARQPGPARRRLDENLHQILDVFAAVGIAMPAQDRAVLQEAAAAPDDLALEKMQSVLDHYALLDVNLTDEAWFVLHAAAATPAGRPLTQGRWATFLIKVRNDSRVTSPFAVRSDQGLQEGEEPEAPLSATCPLQPHNWAQWFKLRMLGPPLMNERLSGTEIEYFVIQMCSLDSGDRAAELTFYLGGGLVSQGHYGSLSLLFRPRAADGPSVDGAPARRQ